MDDQRRSLEKVVFRWVGHLIDNEACISGLADLADGVTFPALVEKVTGIAVNNLHTSVNLNKSQRRQNVENALTLLKNTTRLDTRSYKAQSILDGKPKILDLILRIFKYYLGNKLKNVGLSGPGLYDGLKTWINGVLQQLYDIHNFRDNMRSCKAIAGLINAADPGLFPDWVMWLDVHDPATVSLVLAKAEEVGVKRWLYTEHFGAPIIDEDCMVIYLHQFLDQRQQRRSKPEPAYAQRAYATKQSTKAAAPRPRSTGVHLPQPVTKRTTFLPADYKLSEGDYVLQKYSDPDSEDDPSYALYRDPDVQYQYMRSPDLMRHHNVTDYPMRPDMIARGPKAAPRTVPSTKRLSSQQDAIGEFEGNKLASSPVSHAVIHQSSSTPQLTSEGSPDRSSTPDLSISPSSSRTPQRQESSKSSSDSTSAEDLLMDLLTRVTLADDTKKLISTHMKYGTLSIHQPDKPIATGIYGDVCVITHTVRLRPRENKEGTSEFKRYTATTVRDGLATAKFLEESVNMLFFKNDNVIKVKGFYLHGEKIVRLMEHMDMGVLREYLIKHEQVMPQVELNAYAKGIANGMAYLHAQGFVQRNLNCSTVWLSRTENAEVQAKIVDFGFMRDVNNDDLYVMTSGISQCSLAYEWMAPEVLAESDTNPRFNQQTDVWSFGATMVELYDLGRIPYQALKIHGPEQILRYLKKGYRLPTPDRMSLAIWEDVTMPCLHMDPLQRPSFSTIQARLDIVLKLDGKFPKMTQMTLKGYTQLAPDRNTYDLVTGDYLYDDTTQQTVPKHV